MVYTYSRDYDKEILPWPNWVARLTNVRDVGGLGISSAQVVARFFQGTFQI